MKAVYLYPATCYFEATPVSLGRGTSLPFQVYGHPNMTGYDYSFTPKKCSRRQKSAPTEQAMPRRKPQ